ncbi:MAG: hypothetical protein E4H13_15210, partial [Calditrichales bacterium]
MRKTVNIIIIIILMGGVYACTVLRSPHYVGVIQNPLKLDEDLQRFSTWQYEGSVYQVHVVDSTSIIACTMNWDKTKKEYTTKCFPLLITSLDDKYFLNLEEEDSLYTLFRVSGTSEDDGTIVFVTADNKFLDKQIAAGDSPLSKSGENTYIFNTSKEEMDQFIQSHINDLFPFGTVGVIKPLAGYKGKP